MVHSMLDIFRRAEVCTRVGHSVLKLVHCNTSKSEPIGAIPHTPSNSLVGDLTWLENFCRETTPHKLLR